MTLAKPQLRPVLVPWMISPSIPHLDLHVSVSGAPLCATFVGYFKLDDRKPTPPLHGMPEIVRGVPEFEPRSMQEAAPHRMVRVNFVDGAHYRISGAASDIEVIPEDRYDWSLVPCSDMLPGESLRENTRRSHEFWLTAGYAPDPGMYEIVQSPWLAELKPSNLLPWHHYLLLSNDRYVEVVARGWNWEPGQAV